MFGSDWPGPGVPDPRNNIEDFYDLPLSEETKRQILYNTAAELLGRD
jgi:predicted TIM-barrel fold metal-dependent hydrolase